MNQVLLIGQITFIPQKPISNPFKIEEFVFYCGDCRIKYYRILDIAELDKVCIYVKRIFYIKETAINIFGEKSVY